MKSVLKNYVFVAASKTITLTDITTVRLDRLALITDTTTNTILYNFADATVSTATVATNVITLSTVGTAASTDKLRIDYDVDTTDVAFGDTTNITKVTTLTGGGVASGATDSGNPLKVGGVYNSTPPVLTTGQRGDLQLDSSGRTLVSTAPLSAAIDAVGVQAVTAEQVSLTAGVLNADLVASTDVSSYRTASLQVAGTWVGTLIVQHSNDNVNFLNRDVDVLRVSTSVLQSTITANDIYHIPIYGRYLRVRMTSYTSGTATGTLELSALPTTTNKVSVYNGTINATQNGTYTVQPGNTANTTAWKVDGSAVTQPVSLATNTPTSTPVTPTTLFLTSAATTNATNVKAVGGTMFSINASNTGAAAAFLKIFNTSAAPTVGTTVPQLTIPIPASGVALVSFESIGSRFVTGISLSITNLIVCPTRSRRPRAAAFAPGVRMRNSAA